jgi:hypothetical protein
VADVVRELNEKIGYARKRWGCTLFYVDSNGDQNWPVEARKFREVAAANPDVLLIPEHETLGYYAYTAPYCELRRGCTSTLETVRKIYPDAFSVISVTHGDIRSNWASLGRAVRSGDILLLKAGFDAPAERLVRELYEGAHEAE